MKRVFLCTGWMHASCVQGSFKPLLEMETEQIVNVLLKRVDRQECQAPRSIQLFAALYSIAQRITSDTGE